MTDAVLRPVLHRAFDSIAAYAYDWGTLYVPSAKYISVLESFKSDGVVPLVWITTSPPTEPNEEDDREDEELEVDDVEPRAAEEVCLEDLLDEAMDEEPDNMEEMPEGDHMDFGIHKYNADDDYQENDDYQETEAAATEQGEPSPERDIQMEEVRNLKETAAVATEQVERDVCMEEDLTPSWDEAAPWLCDLLTTGVVRSLRNSLLSAQLMKPILRSPFALRKTYSSFYRFHMLCLTPRVVFEAYEILPQIAFW